MAMIFIHSSIETLCQNVEKPVIKLIQVQFTQALLFSTILSCFEYFHFCHFIFLLHYIYLMQSITSYCSDSDYSKGTNYRCIRDIGNLTEKLPIPIMCLPVVCTTSINPKQWYPEL